MRFHTLRLCVAFSLAAAMFAQPVHAQVYPTKPIRIIVPLEPGGGGDLIARVIGQKMGEGFKQPVIVENKPGAATMIGTEFVARSTPDGYTLVMATSSHGINPGLYKLRYDPVKDFSGVSLVAVSPLMLAVHPKVPANSTGDLIKLAKANPGDLKFASNGNASVGHLSSELFAQLAGIKLLHVPYKGSGPAMNDLLAGNIDLMFTTPATAISFAKLGRLRPLAMSSAKRSPAMPDIPTLAETGLPGFESEAWYALLAPAGVPAPIVNRLSEEAARVVKLPEVRERLTGVGIDFVGSTPQEAMDRVQMEINRWAAVLKAANIKAD